MFNWFFNLFDGTDRELERQRKYKEYVNAEYTKATNSHVMKGVSLVLFDECEYKIIGLNSGKPIPPTLFIACESHYDVTSAKKHYIKIYHYRLRDERDKNYVHVK